MSMYFHFLDKTSEHRLLELIDNENNWIYHWDSQNGDNKEIGGFKKINFFVGANNSGKSRFLRALLKSNELEVSISKGIKSIKSQHKESSDIRDKIFSYIQTSQRGIIAKLHKSIVVEDFIKKPNILKEFIKSFNDINRSFILQKNTGLFNKNTSSNITRYYNSIENLLDNIQYVINNSPNIKAYIPILRAIKSNDYLNKEDFKGTVKKNYGIVNNVFTGLELYDQVYALKNSSIRDRRKIIEFENFLSKHFFDNEKVEITPDSKSKEILFSKGDVEYPIFDLGDGVQSLIILLFPIFIANKNDWFFIEEPEMNLHPGLQRIFIETLLNDPYLKEKNLRYFFTTHSNHFLDSSLDSDDISIFQFKNSKSNRFHIKTNVKPNKETLDILGVNNSSVFLANTSIWVEGPTDRKYISKLLKLYTESKEIQPLKQDIDFSFFEYAGNLIQHYIFEDNVDFNEEEVREKINSFSLSNKIFLLADNDGAEEHSAKDERKNALTILSNQQDNFQYENTICREIENLLPVKIIKEFAQKLVFGIKDDEVNLNEFNRDDYKDLGLGHFYEDLLQKSGVKSDKLKSFKAKSGTLTNFYKLKLCEFVVDSDYTYSEFIENNKELENLIESLFSFIKK